MKGLELGQGKGVEEEEERNFIFVAILLRVKSRTGRPQNPRRDRRQTAVCDLEGALGRPPLQLFLASRPMDTDQ